MSEELNFFSSTFFCFSSIKLLSLFFFGIFVAFSVILIISIGIMVGISIGFGSNKLVEQLPNGDNLGLVAARNLDESVDKLIVVVKNQKDPTTTMFLENGYQVVIADNSDLGMGNSLLG